MGYLINYKGKDYELAPYTYGVAAFISESSKQITDAEAAKDFKTKFEGSFGICAAALGVDTLKTIFGATEEVDCNEVLILADRIKTVYAEPFNKYKKDEAAKIAESLSDTLKTVNKDGNVFDLTNKLKKLTPDSK